MTPLEAIIRRQINQFGPMNIAEYMTLCLLHPEHGYYMSKDPLGSDGDFTTSPEISQMFGEMLGLSLAQSWLDQGSPESFVLAELGPGRGTLMADILRVGARVLGFVESADIWLVEASPHLRAVQGKTLSGHQPTWADQASDLPQKPLFLIANEFFDALPVRQFLRADGGWQEQMVGLADDKLVFGLAAPMQVATLEDQDPSAIIVETRTAADGPVSEAALRIAAHGGTAMIVDYGDWGSTGDSFQAVRAHQKVDPLDQPGSADLTAHVDFQALAKAASATMVSAMTTQGTLLERLGITARAERLAERLEGDTLVAHIQAHRRLTHPAEMGSLFKAIALYPDGAPVPPGFEP